MRMTTQAQTIAANLHRLRRRANLTQAELAQRMAEAGHSAWVQSTVYKAENAEKPGRKISFEEGLALAEILDASPSALAAPLDLNDEGWREFQEAGYDLSRAVKTLTNVLAWTRVRMDRVDALARRRSAENEPVEKSDLMANTRPEIRLPLVALEAALERFGWRGAPEPVADEEEAEETA